MSKCKRLCAAAMTAAMLAGCGSGSGSSTGSGGESITLCLSTRDEWLSTLATAAINTGKEQGYEVIVQDCQNDVNKQIQYVETVRNNGADVVIINLVNYKLAEEVIKAVGDMSVVFCQPDAVRLHHCKQRRHGAWRGRSAGSGEP